MLALSTVIILFVLFSVWSPKPRETTHPPPDFYAVSKEVSLTEMLTVADNNNISLYLPSELPKNLNLTAIYLKEGNFIAIVVYSAEGNKDYKTAEFGIEIAHIGIEQSPTFEELQSRAKKSENETALEINGWPILVLEKASCSYPERREKYGDYQRTVRVYIEGIRYSFGAPTLTTDEMIQIIQNMRKS